MSREIRLYFWSRELFILDFVYRFYTVLQRCKTCKQNLQAYYFYYVAYPFWQSWLSITSWPLWPFVSFIIVLYLLIPVLPYIYTSSLGHVISCFYLSLTDKFSELTLLTMGTRNFTRHFQSLSINIVFVSGFPKASLYF